MFGELLRRRHPDAGRDPRRRRTSWRSFPSSRRRSTTRDGRTRAGALMQWFASTWASILAEDTAAKRRPPVPAGRTGPRSCRWTLPAPRRPLTRRARALLSRLGPTRDQRRLLAGGKGVRPLPAMTVKGLHAGGWHDLFLKGTIENYRGLREKAANAGGARRPTAPPRSLVPRGPPPRKAGSETWSSARTRSSTDRRGPDWFDYAFKGAANDYADGTPVRMFVMGENPGATRRSSHSRGPVTRATTCTRRRPKPRPGWDSVRAGAGFGAAGHLHLRPGEPRPHHRRPPLLRRRHPPRPARREPEQSRRRRRARLLHAAPRASDVEVTGDVKLGAVTPRARPSTPTSPPSWWTWTPPGMPAS